MSTTGTPRVGMGQPYAIRLTVPSALDFDPGAVTGATLNVTRPNGTTYTRPMSVDAQSATSVTVSYRWALGEPDVDGAHRGWIQFTQAGATPGPRSEVFTFIVKRKDQQ
jgi:hypothetical protein